MDYLSKNVPYFRQDYLGLFEIVDYLHYLRLFEIIANYLWIICFGLFVDYLKYPCDPGSGDASRPVGIDLPVNHAYPSDDLRLKYFKSV